MKYDYSPRADLARTSALRLRYDNVSCRISLFTATQRASKRICNPDYRTPIYGLLSRSIFEIGLNRNDHLGINVRSYM